MIFETHTHTHTTLVINFNENINFPNHEFKYNLRECVFCAMFHICLNQFQSNQKFMYVKEIHMFVSGSSCNYYYYDFHMK